MPPIILFRGYIFYKEWINRNQKEKTKLIRLGGDEVLILLEDQKQDEVMTYIKKLTQQLDDYNNRAEKEYRLELSYGITSYAPIKNSS